MTEEKNNKPLTLLGTGMSEVPGLEETEFMYRNRVRKVGPIWRYYGTKAKIG